MAAKKLFRRLLKGIVVNLMLLGGHLPMLGFGQLGDLSGFGQLWANLGDLLLQALFT